MKLLTTFILAVSALFAQTNLSTPVTILSNAARAVPGDLHLCDKSVNCATFGDIGINGNNAFRIVGRSASNGNITLQPGNVATLSSVFVEQPRVDTPGFIVQENFNTTSSSDAFRIEDQGGVAWLRFTNTLNATQPGNLQLINGPLTTTQGQPATNVAYQTTDGNQVFNIAPATVYVTNSANTNLWWALVTDTLNGGLMRLADGTGVGGLDGIGSQALCRATGTNGSCEFANSPNNSSTTIDGGSFSATVAGHTVLFAEGLSGGGSLFTYTGASLVVNSITPSGISSTVGSTTNALNSSGISTNGGLTLGITGATQCLQVNASGVVSGTGTPCGTGSGGVTSLNTLTGALSITAGTGITVTPSSPNITISTNAGTTCSSAFTDCMTTDTSQTVTGTKTFTASILASGTVNIGSIGAWFNDANIQFPSVQDISFYNTSPTFEYSMGYDSGTGGLAITNNISQHVIEFGPSNSVTVDGGLTVQGTLIAQAALDAQQGINDTGDILPTAAGSYNLGSASAYWNNAYSTLVYTNGLLPVGGASISVTANLAPQANNTYNLGASGDSWANGYITNLFTGGIASGTVSATTYLSPGFTGQSCSGAPTASFQTVGGIVVHC